MVDPCQFSPHTMNARSEEHAAIKFCICLNKSGAETVTLLHQAYQDECLWCSTILRWHHTFVEGRDSAALTPHGEQPATAMLPFNVNTVSVVIEEDCRLSTRKIAGPFNMTQSSVN